MKNTKANRQKFLRGYLKILLSWKNKKQNIKLMEKSLKELNKTLPKPDRKVILYKSRNDLWSDLWSNLKSDLRSDLGSDLRSDLGNDLWSDLKSETWEYYESIWPIFVGYFYKNLPTVKRRLPTIKALDECIKSGIGYLWLSSTTLYALPFPKISIDAEKRLHCENGPACEWASDEKFWWIHGVKVTQKIVETPNKLTKNDWLNEKNAEVRRIIQDRMPDFAKKVGAKRIQKDDYGELVEIELPNDPEKIARYVKVKDSSTTRLYYLRIPPTVETCKAGIAWSFGLEEKDYLPDQET